MGRTYGTVPLDGTAPGCAAGAEGQTRRACGHRARMEGTARSQARGLPHLPRRPPDRSLLKRRSYVDTRAKPGRHRYFVLAVDDHGRRGKHSKVVRARMPVPPPAPPVRAAADPAAQRRPAAHGGDGRPPVLARGLRRDAGAARRLDGPRPPRRSSTGCSTRRRRSAPTATPPLTRQRRQPADRPAGLRGRAGHGVARPHAARASTRCASGSRSSGTATGRSAATTASRAGGCRLPRPPARARRSGD